MESCFCVEGSAEIDANLQHVSEIERDVQRKKNRTISRVFFPFWYKKGLHKKAFRDLLKENDDLMKRLSKS